MEWKINAQQGILFALLYEAPAWAKEEIIENKYKWNTDIKTITKSLYGKVEKAKYLIFRQKNMPYKSVFPEEVTDTMNLIGLFNRSKELK